ncbi:T9SS type A sorting domain-containing protein [bacterium]|nr:T9SS type A sorting domain-containing protein [bacterium]
MINIKSINLMFSMLLIVVISSLIYAQPTPPLCSDLEPLGSFTAGTSILIRIDPACVSANDAVCDSVRYRFWRVPLFAPSEHYEVTGWIPFTTRLFDGMADGDQYYFQAQACCWPDTSDTSNRSIPQITTMDSRRPSLIDPLEIALCHGPADPQITLMWQKATDSASGVEKYRIYRAEYMSPLNYIRLTDPYIDEIPSDNSDCFDYTDNSSTGLMPYRTYYYTVVAFDSVGNFHRYSNPIVHIETGFPLPVLPPCAILKDLPEYYSASEILVEVDLDVCSPNVCAGCAGTQYRFVRTSALGTDTTDWSTTPNHLWDGEECITYSFTAQGRYYAEVGDSFMVGPWSPVRNTTQDSRGPEAVDSISGETMPGGWNMIQWYVPPYDTSSMDCGSGLCHYNLYRVTRDQLDDLFPINSEDDDYLLGVFNPRAVIAYSFADYDTSLRWGTCYYYTVIGRDCLGYFSPDEAPLVEVCLPPKIQPFKMHTLDTWNCTDEVTIEFVDTNYCLAESVLIQRAMYSDFRDARNFGWYGINDPLLSNPDDGDCYDWDTLSFTFTGLGENRYYFRVQCKDILDNYSDWSNVSTTRIDNANPGSPIIDSIFTTADYIATVDVTLKWLPVRDAGTGLANYIVYRSDTPGSLGEPLATLPPYRLYYVDENPLPDNYFHNNYYQIVSVDNCGHRGEIGTQVSLTQGVTPPYPPMIDSICVDPSGNNLIVTWNDTTPYGYGSPFTNRYQLEHAESESWLWIDDPLLLDKELPTYNQACTLAIDEVLSGTNRKYFHLKTIDVWDNESGFSEHYMYTYTPPPDDTIYVDFCAGWNMISLPVIPSFSNVASVLIPGADENVYYYDPATRRYEVSHELQVGKGYMVFVDAAVTVPFIGRALMEYTAPVFEGWNLLGAVSYPAEFSTYPSGIQLGSVWYYDCFSDRYQATEVFEPGMGHWFMARADGALVLPAEGLGKRTSDTIEPEWLVELNLGDQVLNFGLHQYASVYFDQGLDEILPPQLPDREYISFFICEDGYQLATDIRSGMEVTWEFYLAEPTVIHWDSRALPKGQLEITTSQYNDINMNELSYINAQGKISITYNRIIPEGFALNQNIPNPFNAHTQISFYLNEETAVSLEVYDITGSLVNTIFHGQGSAGSNILYWDGTDWMGRSVGSGIYLYTISCDRFKETKKMLLLR